MVDIPKTSPAPAPRIDANNTQTNPEQTTETVKQRENAISSVKNISTLNTLDGSADFLVYLKQADIADIQQFLLLVQFLQGNNQLQDLIMKLDSSCGDGFPDGKTVKFSDIFKAFQKQIGAAKAGAIDQKEAEAETKKVSDKTKEAAKTAEKTEVIKTKDELTKDLQSAIGAPNAFKKYIEGKGIEQLLLLQKSDKVEEKEQFQQILKEFQAELLANGSKDNFVTYKRVTENFRTLGVIDDTQYLRWMTDAQVKPVEGTQAQTAPTTINGFEKNGDTFVKLGKGENPSMMIADGKMMCIGKEGFKLSSYFPSKEFEQQYLEYRQSFEKLSTEKAQKETLAKNLGSILEKLGPISDNISAEEFVQRITESEAFKNSTIKTHFENFIKENPNMRREDKIKSILNAMLTFAGLDKLPPGMPLMLSLHNTRSRLGEKNTQTTERIKEISTTLAKLKNPQLETFTTEQEQKEKLMAKTVKYVESLGLDCFGSKADIAQLLQKFEPVLQKAGDGFKPDIGSGEHWMGKESIKSLCNIISLITGITPKETLFENLELNPPTLKKTLPESEASKYSGPMKIPSVRELIKARLEKSNVVKEGIFSPDKALMRYNLELQQSQEKAEKSKDMFDASATVERYFGKNDYLSPVSMDQAFAVQAKSPSAANEKSSDQKTHTVEKGDNLTKIARANNISLEELLQANPHKKENPNMLKIGEKINIPAKQSETPKASATEAPAK